MTRGLLLLGLVLGLTVPVAGQQPAWTYIKTATEVTVAGTAVALFTAADVQQGNGHPQATVATCTLTGANIRVAPDQDPTTSLGNVLTPGTYTVYGSAYMAAVKGIRDDSTSATWNCTIYGQ